MELILVVLGECLLMNVCKKDLRISRDWLGDSWINIMAKPEITKTIIFTANNSFNTELYVSPSIAKDVDSVGFANSCHGDPVSKKSNEPVVIKEENFVFACWYFYYVAGECDLLVVIWFFFTLPIVMV